MILYQAINKEAQRVKAAHPNVKFESFWPDDVCQHHVDLDNVEGMLGSIEWTYQMFDYFGIRRPPVFNYKYCSQTLRYQFKRFIVTQYLEDYNFDLDWGSDVFVKPAVELKHFEPRIILINHIDCGRLSANHSDFQKLISDLVEIQQVVKFGDEYRTFWVKQSNLSWKCLGGAQYPVYDQVNTVLPDFGFDPACLIGFPHDAVVVDFGWRPDINEWCVVEIGDVWAMGSYGAEEAYLEAHMVRFAELKKDLK